MKRRLRGLPVVQIALVAVSLLVGLALVPVAAQTAAGLEGQVAIRSDGAVYLISGGQRRWVATVVISDEELNSYPEAEPIFVGLAPFGGGGGTTAAAKPAAAAPPAAAAQPAAGAAPAAATPTATAGTASSTGPEPTPTLDPKSMVQATGGACPASHQIKGATTAGVKTYYEPDRPEWPNITPEVCFVAGSYARSAGYVASKK